MKDIDKIKEKTEKDEVKSTIGLVLLFLVIFGVIAFAIIELTGEYFELKRELNKSKMVKNDEAVLDESSKKYGYTLEGDKINVKEIEGESASFIGIENTETPGKIEENEGKKKEDQAEDKILILKPQKEKSETSQNIPLATTKKPLEVEPKKKDKAGVDKNSLYAVQLMAFKSENDAKIVVEKYKNDIKDIYYIKADLGEKGIWYRVRCCSTDSLDEAKSTVNELQKNLKLKPIVVKRR